MFSRLVKFILFYNCIFSNFVQANCLKDIYSIGLGFTSSSYNLENNKNAKNTNISSTSGTNIKANWIIYCPSKKTVYSTSFNLRFLKFDNNKNLITSKLENDHKLYDSELSITKNFNKNVDYFYNLGIYQDLIFFDNGQGYFASSTTTNFEFSVGGKYYILTKQLYNLLAFASLGPTLPIENNGKHISGQTKFRFGIHGIYKLKKYNTLSMELYYSSISKEIENIEQSTRNLTLNIAALKRF